MKLEKIGRLELAYTEVDEELPFAEGGQVYGILTGRAELGDLSGTLHATNLARQRPDGAFTPALRGILTTPDGGKSFFTMDGLSLKDPTANPPRRIVTAALTFWSANPKLAPWNNVLAVAELEGRALGATWGVMGNVFRCVADL